MRADSIESRHPHAHCNYVDMPHIRCTLYVHALVSPVRFAACSTVGHYPANSYAQLGHDLRKFTHGRLFKRI